VLSYSAHVTGNAGVAAGHIFECKVCGLFFGSSRTK